MKKILYSLLMPLLVLLAATTAGSAAGASRSDMADGTGRGDYFPENTCTSSLCYWQDTADNYKDECCGGLPLSFDTRGLEVLTPGHEYMLDGMVHFSVEKMTPVSNNRENVLNRIKDREGHDLRLYTLTPSDEHSQLLSYPAWLVVYDKGNNEDSRHCVDIYVHTDAADFRLHSSVPVDVETAYHDEIGRRLATVVLKD